MICKKIINYSNKTNELDKYEFDLFIASKKENLENYHDKTIVIVEEENDSDKVLDSINKSINNPGLITTTIIDLYEIFYNSGIWNFKYIIKNNTNEIITELIKIETDKIFITIFANKNKSLYDYTDMIKKIRKNEKKDIFFSFPLEKNNKDYIEIFIFYK